jgi:predicted amidophosphoribosyltransferase
MRLLDLIFPPRCASCGESGTILCAKCHDSMRTPEPPLCPCCGHARVSAIAACPIYRNGRGPVALTGMRAAVRYEGVVREAILALKFRGQLRVAEPLGEPLGELLADLCVQVQIPVDVIVPVPLPLHAAGQRQRGYNQAELLARQTGLRLARPMRVDRLSRVRATPPQTTLPATERRRNVMDAFARLRAGTVRTRRAWWQASAVGGRCRDDQQHLRCRCRSPTADSPRLNLGYRRRPPERARELDGTNSVR